MKLLLLSDLHLDTPFRWARPEVARKRRQALRDTLTRAVQLARHEAVDALLVGGDLYEQDRFSPDTGEFLRATFERLEPLPVYIAPGNHDWYAPASVYRQVRWSPNVHVRSARLEPVELADGVTLWGAAHLAPANTDGFLESFRVQAGGVHLALFHGSEMGELSFQPEGKAPHAPFRSEQIARAGLHHAFLGHFHRPRDADLFTYPGNPDPLSFGEEGERGVVLATVHDDGSVVRERRRVAVTQVHDLLIDLTGCASHQDVRERITSGLADLRGFVRVTVTGEVGPDVDLRLQDLSALDGRPEGIVVRATDVRVRYDLEAIAAERTVRGEFVREVRAADLPADQVRRVIVTGLRALDNRDDLEVL